MPIDEHDPELSTNEEWRGIMARARKAHGLTQEQLGAKVGLSQVMISKLESGESASSTAVLAICRELEIPEPQNFADEDTRDWWQMGHVLRQRNPEGYEAAKRMMRTLVKQLEATAQPSDEDHADETPPQSRKRPPG